MSNEKDIEISEKKAQKVVKKVSSVVEFIEPFLLVTSAGSKIIYREFKKGSTLAATEEELQYLKDQRALIKIDGL